jgi:hypothetical protein
MKARQEEDKKSGKKGKKGKKEKPHRHERSKSSSSDSGEKEEKVSKHGKHKHHDKKEKHGKHGSKGEISKTVQGIVDDARLDSVGGEMAAGSSKRAFYLKSGRNKVFKFMSTQQEEKFRVQLRSKTKPKELGLKDKDWDKAGKGKYLYKGDPKTLAKKIRIVFKALKASSKK